MLEPEFLLDEPYRRKEGGKVLWRKNRDMKLKIRSSFLGFQGLGDNR